MSDPAALDGWPAYDHRIASVHILHAIAQAHLGYNFLEQSIGLIFPLFMPTNWEFSAKFFHTINNRTRIDLLSAIIKEKESDDRAKEALLYLLQCFEICTENRNILAHAIVDVAHSVTHESSLSKKASKDPTREIKFQLKLPELRGVADDILVTFEYAMALHSWLVHRTNPSALFAASMGWPAPPAPAPLPNKPQKPHTMTTSQLQAIPKGDISPPQSSGA